MNFTFQRDEIIINKFNETFYNYLKDNQLNENHLTLNKILVNIPLSQKLKFFEYSCDKDGPKIVELFSLIEQVVRRYETDNEKVKIIGNELLDIWKDSIDIDIGDEEFRINTTKTGKKTRRKRKTKK